MGVNSYFGSIQKNRPHATPNYGTVNIGLNYILTYRHIVIQKK